MEARGGRTKPDSWTRRPASLRLDEHPLSPALCRATRQEKHRTRQDKGAGPPEGPPMKIVDMSHVMNVHTPGWVGYAGNKMYYAQNLQTKRIVAPRIDTALHAGTHIDGAMHGTDGMGDIASYPLDFLVGPGAVIDV